MRTIFAAGALVFSVAAQEKSVKVTVMVSAVPDEEAIKPIRDALTKLSGIKVKAEDISTVEPQDNFKNHFSKPFVIELTDPSKVDLGAVAKAIAETKVKERGQRGPWLTLVLYDPTLKVEESDVVSLREAMANVNGLDAGSAGGTGGSVSESTLWVRIDGSGGAKLSEIQAALRKAELDLRFTKQ